MSLPLTPSNKTTPSTPTLGAPTGATETQGAEAKWVQNSTSDPLPAAQFLHGNRRPAGPIPQGAVELSPATFVPLNPKDPRIVDALAVVSKTPDPNSQTVRHYSVQLKDGRGQDVGSPMPFSIEFRPQQDVLDLLPYFEKNGQLWVVANTRLRPAVTARQSRIAEPDQQNFGGVLEGVAAGYVRLEDGETGLDRTAHRILTQKLGLKVNGPLEFLGGSYFPSVGASVEQCYPRAIKVAPPPRDARVTFGQGLEGMSGAEVLEAPEVIRRYQSGELHDLRLVELVLRLLEQRGQAVPLHGLARKLTAKTRDKDLGDLGARLTSAEALKALLSGAGDAAAIDHLVYKAAPTPAKPFLLAESLVVQNRGKDGQALDEYDCQIVTRRTVDSVDIGCYFWKDGEVYLAVKRGVRPALAVRDEVPHPIQSSHNPVHLEGVAGSLEGEKDLAGIAALAKREVIEELQIPPIGEPIYLGSGFPSPGTNPERAYQFLVEVDPSQSAFLPQTADETVSVHYVKLADVLALADQGLIRDPRLLLQARLLAGALGQRRDDAALTPQARALRHDLLSVLNSGLELQRWLSDQVRDTDNRLSRIPDYRKLKNFAINELGAVAIHPEHPSEKGFFSSLLPVFAVPTPDDPTKLPFYLAHDFWHYTLSEYLPFELAPDGELRWRPIEDYLQANCAAECNAVWYSDVVLPRRYGHQATEETFGGISVGRAFELVGCDEQQARQAIESIELLGVIPERILRHPEFEGLRGIFVDRLLKYHVMDALQTRVLYRTWQENPELAKVAARFGEHHADLTAYQRQFTENLERILNYAEGANPLKAQLTKVMSFDLRTTALRLAYVKQLVSAHQGDGHQGVLDQLDRAIDGLHRAWQTLRPLAAGVRDAEPSPENLRALEVLRSIQAGPLAQAEALYGDVAKSAVWLAPEQRQKLEGRLLPHFESLTLDPQQVREGLAKALEANFGPSPREGPSA
ncbi:MAG: hypothetical protein IPG45_36490 [Deltaproteobacteria bacterium]|nr:hypothetical protein [Deltaproteobacteria bacterium]